MSREAVFFAPYRLIPKTSLNARTPVTPREGALLKMGEGYADLHPWPEFGDAPLEAQLNALAQGGTTPLLDRARVTSRLDGEARKAGRSLFAGLEMPRNHKLWPSSETPDLERLRSEGFERLKLKVGRDVDAEIARLTRLAERLPGAGFRVRLDFNGLASEEAFSRFMGRLSSSLLDAIDFVEDPLETFHLDAWARCARRFDVRLALDSARVPLDAVFEEGDAIDVFVVKPARQNPSLWAERAMNSIRRLVVTSNMDHPLGQCAAAFEAARLQKQHPLLVDDAGLLTQDLFESINGFSLEVRDARLVPPAGTGLGFDAQLEKLPWRELP